MKVHTTTHVKISEQLHDERGATLLEYALIVSLIAIASIAAVSLVGGSVSDTFDTAAGSLPSATIAAPVDYPTATNGVDGKVSATFAVIDGTVVLESYASSGWTHKITKDTGSRVNVKFTNDTTGEVIRVNGWVNKKGKLKTKVKA